MTDDEVARCHGPGCTRVITYRSPSPWFCTQVCWRAWLAQRGVSSGRH